MNIKTVLTTGTRPHIASNISLLLMDVTLKSEEKRLTRGREDEGYLLMVELNASNPSNNDENY